MENKILRKDEVRHIVKNINPYKLDNIKNSKEYANINFEKNMWYTLGCVTLTVAAAYLNVKDPFLVSSQISSIAASIGIMGGFSGFSGMMNNLAKKINCQNIITEFEKTNKQDNTSTYITDNNNNNNNNNKGRRL